MPDPTPIRGRWIMLACDECGTPYSPACEHVRKGLSFPGNDKLLPAHGVEVVLLPDEQAIERAARALHLTKGFSERSWSTAKCSCRQQARAVLAAALEQPE